MTPETLKIEILEPAIAGPIGGAVVRGHSNEYGPISCLLSFRLVTKMPDAGESWIFRGTLAQHNIYGLQIRCQSAIQTNVTGEQIPRFLAKNSLFKGIGEKTAQKLWEHFGSELENVLDNKDLKSIKSVIGSKALTVISLWHSHRCELKSLWLLQSIGISPTVANAFYAYYRDLSLNILTGNPYCLIPFTTWGNTDKLGRSHGIASNDDRRLIAAVLAALKQNYQSGNTAINEDQLTVLVSKNLDLSINVAKQAINTAKEKNLICYSSSDTKDIQHTGINQIEMAIAAKLQCKMKLPQKPIPKSWIADLINLEHELEITYSLEQKNAIQIAFSSPVSIIYGNSGCGKTTLLKAVYKNLDNTIIYQIALTGKMASHLQDLTGIKAYTVAKFISSFSSTNIKNKDILLVIDGANMIDIATIALLFGLLPSNARLLLLGDKNQLSPIGPGLFFHTLIASKIPQIELTKNYRSNTAIIKFSHSITQGIWPELPIFKGQKNGVYMMMAHKNELNDILKKLIAQCDPDTQIITAFKNGYGGSQSINDSFVSHRMSNHNGNTLSQTFTVGDPIVYTENDYSRNLNNGSLGKIVQCFDFPISKKINNITYNNVLYEAEFDDGNIYLTLDDVFSERIEHAYAINIHKAQGYDFNSVIIPVTKSKFIDLPMLYSAATKAKKLLIFVGDISDAKNIVESRVKNTRTVGFIL